MINDWQIKEVKDISLSLFRKNFFGIQNGSISLKNESDSFMINKKNILLDKLESDSFIELYFKKDYRWREADENASIHLQIYKNIETAKYISFSMPPYTTAYSLNHSIISPKDYFGYLYLGDMEVYDPKNFETWKDRAEYEIYNYLKQNDKRFIIIKGYGIYIYDRDLYNMAQTLSLIENSCRILTLSTV
jgi:L-fuculose-phosphate aldolase